MLQWIDKAGKTSTYRVGSKFSTCTRAEDRLRVHIRLFIVTTIDASLLSFEPTVMKILHDH